MGQMNEEKQTHKHEHKQTNNAQFIFTQKQQLKGEIRRKLLTKN